MTFLANGAGIRTYGFMIKANDGKYSISALCKCFGIAQSIYYYECYNPIDESERKEALITASDEKRRLCGQRKL